MQNTETPLALGNTYKKGISITIIDPVERASYANQPLEFKAVNNNIMPVDEDSRSNFLADLSLLVRTGSSGNFLVVEENLRKYYLVVIGGEHRVSRKIYATHPAIPGKLLVIGGVGIVRPDELNHCITLQTPKPDFTLHRLFPDLLETSMSAAYPTHKKTIESTPNVDPVGGYSIRVAETKFHNVEMISLGKRGIDPNKFPVVTNVAWGKIGENLAFYVYAVPDNAIPVCELLHASNREEITAALGHYIPAGQKLVQALRHLHEVGYVFNQPHQGNVYYYQDTKGEDSILIADLDTLQSIKDFSAKVPQGKYLSPRAFATLVNIQVAATHMARICWIDFVTCMIGKLQIEYYPGVDIIYTSIIFDMITSYIKISDSKQSAEIYSSIRKYYIELDRHGKGYNDQSQGIRRLIQSDLYETDVFGFLFTFTLMNDDYCKRFGAKPLTEGIKQAGLDRIASATYTNLDKSNQQVISSALNQAMSYIIEERSNQAMQEYIQAFTKKIRKIMPNQ